VLGAFVCSDCLENIYAADFRHVDIKERYRRQIADIPSCIGSSAEEIVQGFVCCDYSS